MCTYLSQKAKRAKFLKILGASMNLYTDLWWPELQRIRALVGLCLCATAYQRLVLPSGEEIGRSEDPMTDVGGARLKSLK
jgi:hypothetical protein